MASLHGRRAVAVLVADDDARIRRALREMIARSADTVVVGEASSPMSVLHLDLALSPDVVVLDLRLPHTEDGMRVLAELIARGTSVVAISILGSLRAKALELGASSFLEKDSRLGGELMRAIHDAVVDTAP